jgi:triose/dihydroxyacetone kinase / FAD-AMP lyase (cyclizing)
MPDNSKQRVVVISGGGSGHEPAHGLLVGEGLLHSAVVGNVFASPSVDLIVLALRCSYAASRLAANDDGGILIIVKVHRQHCI